MGMFDTSAVLVGLTLGAFVPILRVVTRFSHLLDPGYGLGVDYDEETLEYVGKVIAVIYGLIFMGAVLALDAWTVSADDILGSDHRRVPQRFSDGFSLTHSEAGVLLISFMVVVLIGNRLIKRGEPAGNEPAAVARPRGTRKHGRLS